MLINYFQEIILAAVYTQTKGKWLNVHEIWYFSHDLNLLFF